MSSIECAKAKIRAIIAGSKVPEDPRHAENTLEWLLRLNPTAGPALQIAALGHDIDRAIAETKIQRADFDDYDEFKVAHARHGAGILRPILVGCGVSQDILDEACRLMVLHEVGGDPDSDLLKDADSISYFDVNLPLYYQREGREEAKRRCYWGYRRLSEQRRGIVENMVYPNESLTQLLKEAIQETKSRH